MQYGILEKMLEVGLLSITITVSAGLGLSIIYLLSKIIPWEKDDD